jgi:hypothetical protein
MSARACSGSYERGVRVHPHLGSRECPDCGRRFDYRDCAGTDKVNVPLHTPEYRLYQQQREQS